MLVRPRFQVWRVIDWGRVCVWGVERRMSSHMITLRLGMDWKIGTAVSTQYWARSSYVRDVLAANQFWIIVE